MNKIKTIGIASILAICAMPAFAALPSTDWVNEQLDGKVDVNQGANSANKALITDTNGNIVADQVKHGMVHAGAIRNADIAEQQIQWRHLATGLQLPFDMLATPEPPQECRDGSASCILIYSGFHIAWEVLERDPNNPDDKISGKTLLHGYSSKEEGVPLPDHKLDDNGIWDD